MLKIPSELAQALHDMLMQEPMAKVERFVVALRQLEPVESPAKDAAGE